MTWKRHLLVVANVTAGAEVVIERLRQKDPGEVTLLVPATHSAGGREAAQRALDDALARFRDGGLEAQGVIGDDDACLAVSEIWDPKKFDEIVVCTLPLGSSKWLHAGLPERIGKLTGAPVTHVVVPRPHHQERHVELAPPHQSVPPILAPFTVLGHTEGEAPAK